MPPTSDHKKPGAYAISTETKGEPKFFSLTVPAGVEPGTTFSFTAGERRNLSARCPRTSKPGDILQVALSPEPETHYAPLKMAPLTTLSKEAAGGAKPMHEPVRRANQEFLEETADTFVVTIPPSVKPGQPFVARTPRDERFLVTCPPGAKGGQKLRIRVPLPSGDDDAGLPGGSSSNGSTGEGGGIKTFQIKAPEGVRPNQVLPVLVCGKRIPVTLPSNVVPGQTLNLKLPVQQVVGSIELRYDDYDEDDPSGKGWCRTIRMSDFKFQWVHNEVAPQREARRRRWKTRHSAFCRKLVFLEGNDARMRTGVLDLVPANEVVADSELRHHHRTLVSYATVAHVQTQTLDQKTRWLQGICADLTAPWESGRIKMVVRRSQLLGDSLRAVMALSRADLRKRWRLEFVGEPAIDSGGVMREWFQLVSEQLFDPDVGLWLPSANNQTCMTVNPASPVSCPDDHLVLYRFVGRILGRALFDQQLIRGHLARHLYKHILGWPITFEDLAAQDEEYYQSLKTFTTMNQEEIAAMCLDFTITEDVLGVKTDVDLVPGGTHLEVTADNLPQYLEAILKYRMLDRTKAQINELLLGFFDVVPEPALTVLDPNELELILCGLPTIDMDDWQSNTTYSGDLTADGTEDVVRWFWEVVREDFDQETRARLLQFVTGTSGVPSRGFSVLQGNDGNIKKFCIHGVDRTSYAYPRAHTCFNRIDLPNYSSREELHEKLKAAVTLSAVGFDIE